MSKWTWLVTGASSGQGLEITLAALYAGYKVVATARDVDRAKAEHPEVERLGGLWIELDVTHDDAQAVVEEAVKDHDVNVLVNNAGYGLRGVLEDLSMQQIRAQMDTNFFGAMAVTKGAIPIFRERRQGTIVMISSASALTGTPSQSLYSASKFALEGATEALAAELQPFGIRVLSMVLGAFRTPFQNAVQKPDGVLSDPYKGTTADLTAQRITAGHGRQDGDPVKAAKAIVDVVTGEGIGKDMKDCFRVLLGKDAVVRAEVKIKSLQEDTEKTRKLAQWASFNEQWDGYPPL